LAWTVLHNQEPISGDTRFHRSIPVSSLRVCAAQGCRLKGV